MTRHTSSQQENAGGHRAAERVLELVHVLNERHSNQTDWDRSHRQHSQQLVGNHTQQVGVRQGVSPPLMGEYLPMLTSTSKKPFPPCGSQLCPLPCLVRVRVRVQFAPPLACLASTLCCGSYLVFLPYTFPAPTPNALGSFPTLLPSLTTSPTPPPPKNNRIFFRKIPIFASTWTIHNSKI